MANFFTRLAERSLGLSPVVQPAIASRFSSTSELSDAVNLSQPISPTQEQLSTPKFHTAIRGIQREAQPNISTTTLLADQSLQSASPSIELNAKQSIPSTIHPIVPPSIYEESNRAVSPEPFRVLHSHEQTALVSHPIESHPSLPITQINIETLTTPSIIPPHSSSQQNSLVSVPGIAYQQPISQKPIFQQSISQQSNESDRSTESSLSAQAVIQPSLRSIAPTPDFSQASADRESSSPTIRVSIGRVEVRAIMPTPTPKAAPVRPRPAVSLNDYLKQRGDKS